jgi:hypothetical protein
MIDNTERRKTRKTNDIISDIISGLDDGAITYDGSLNPVTSHSYKGYTIN